MDNIFINISKELLYKNSVIKIFFVIFSFELYNYNQKFIFIKI